MNNQRRNAAWLFLGLYFSTGLNAWAIDRVIMKDGRIYEGRVLDEDKNEVVIRTYGFGSRIRILENDQVLHVARDPEQRPVLNSKYYFSLESLIGVMGSASPDYRLALSPGFYLGGALRPHPAFALAAGFDLFPLQGGDLKVSDGSSLREYEKFALRTYGFALRLYPFFRFPLKTEPYIFGGYSWTRLIPKNSGDTVKGTVWELGLGLERPLGGPVSLVLQTVLRHYVVSTIDFEGREGEFNPPLHQESVALRGGLAYRW